MPKGKRRMRDPKMPIAAYAIDGFCEAHGISRAMYTILKRKGLGPREMVVGRRRFISQEAAAQWRYDRETAR